MAAPRHTLRFLQRRLQALGMTPEPRYGQNFLVDQNLLDILVEAAELSPSDVVLEVGTGTGGLTGRLAERAGHVITVEIDARLQQLAREELGHRTNVTMIHGDVLKNKHTIRPEVLGTVAEHRANLHSASFKLVANLPYNIATPLISNLLHIADPPERMVVTIQKELADRILAHPRTKDYSALSVWLQSFCEIELLRILHPSVFWPRPKVDSAIIKIKPDRERLQRQADLLQFHRFVRAIFLQRRKLLRSALLTLYKKPLGKVGVDSAMQSLNLPGNARAEELSIEMLNDLYRMLQTRTKEILGEAAS